MKRKGFTLIELLAVIVVLTIIAMIATPIIVKVVENARKGADKTSALNYIDAIEKYIIMHDMDEEKYPMELEEGKEYQISNDTYTAHIPLIEKVYAEESNNLNSFIKIRGEKPSKGVVKIGEKGKVESAMLYMSQYIISYNIKTGAKVEGKVNGPRTYIVHYDTNGGKETIDDDTYIYGKEETLTSEEPTRDGYNFLGWSIDKKATKETYKKGATIKDIIESGKEITLYAIWEEIKIVSWSEGTEEEIAKMLKAVDEGKLTMQDTGWKVGDERTVTLGEPVNETVTFVIIDLAGNGNTGPDGKDNTTSGGTVYHALVGQKNSLSTGKQYNSSATNSGGYNATALKTYIDGDYTTSHNNATTGRFYDLIISSNHYQTDGGGLTNLQLTENVKFVLHSEYEIFGQNRFAIGENENNKQFEYYKTENNRIKKLGESGVANIWHGRSGAYYSYDSWPNTVLFTGCNPSASGYSSDGVHNWRTTLAYHSSYGVGFGVAPFAAI